MQIHATLRGRAAVPLALLSLAAAFAVAAMAADSVSPSVLLGLTAAGASVFFFGALAGHGLGRWERAQIARRRALRTPTPPAKYEQLGLNPVASGAEDHTLYLDLMKRALVNLLYEDDPLFVYRSDRKIEPVSHFTLERRIMGEDFPGAAHTMIGLKRLDHLQACVEAVLRAEVAGDLVEAGARRGGATIFMRAILSANGVHDRRVVACDAFLSPVGIYSSLPGKIRGALVEPLFAILAAIPIRSWQRSWFSWLQRWRGSKTGFPVCRDPSDEMVRMGLWLARHPEILLCQEGTGIDGVRSNFARYGLLDEQVVLVKGFFADTLPEAPVSRIAVLRIDADTYESTMIALEHLYPKLSRGGFCIIDDYHAFSDCQRAVDEYRQATHVTAPMEVIDELGVFWQRA